MPPHDILRNLGIPNICGHQSLVVLGRCCIQVAHHQGYILCVFNRGFRVRPRQKPVDDEAGSPPLTKDSLPTALALAISTLPYLRGLLSTSRIEVSLARRILVWNETTTR